MTVSESPSNKKYYFESTKAHLILSSLEVLLVEDCPDYSRPYLRYLQDSKASITLECTGQSAVDMISKSISNKSAIPFDVVIMDFQNPVLDGIESTNQIRKLGYKGAILALTANEWEDLELSWFEAGCDAILIKPLTMPEFITAVSQHTQ